MSRKPYVCYACRDGHHSFCALDLDPKKPYCCDETWHVEIADGLIKRSKGAVRQVIDNRKPEARP